ncbi:MAG: hypothetical protein ACR2F8_13875 [Caulobacteraceae bacterium]
MNWVIRGSARPVALLLALSASSLAGYSAAQTVTRVANPTRPAVSLAPPAPPAIPARISIKIPEGTEVHIAIDDPLSSKTSSAGDMFAFRTTEAIRLSDGTLLPEGYRGRGEVTDVEKKGMLGKAGHLNIRLDYLMVGDVHVHLRQSTGVEGKSGVGTTVALALIVSPLFLMHHGAEAVIPKGQAMTAFVDEDTLVANPPPAARIN